MCPFHEVGETWALSFYWQYYKPCTVIIRRNSPVLWEIQKKSGFFEGISNDLKATACRITDSSIRNAQKGRWIVDVAYNSIYDSAVLTVEYLGDWIYMDYRGVSTESPGDRDIHHKRHFSKKIPVKNYSKRAQLINEVMRFLNESEKKEKPENPMSERTRFELLEKELFR